MADLKISELPSTSDVAAADTLVLNVDGVPVVSSKITWANFQVSGVKAYTDTLYVTPTSVSTLTNKRITPRCGTVASSSDPAIDTGLSFVI